MRRFRVCWLVSVCGLWSATAALAAQDCAGLNQLSLEHAQIRAQAMPAGEFAPPDGAKAVAGLPAFCRVALTLTPVKGSSIGVEVWLPLQGWNGRFQGTGNGGYAGKISYSWLASGLRRGFAVANTDMGLATPEGQDASVFVDQPERWKDWGYRATHEMTLAAKRVVAAFYGSQPKFSYFTGCSTGGQQALMEAQRFPEDYDGIVSGAPAHYRTHVHLNILWNFMQTRVPPEAYLPAEKLSLLAKAALDSCDAVDGVKDGLINDPRRCHFDPAQLQCQGADGANCLTAAQVKAARRIYQGPVDAKTGNPLYAGMPVGTELEWSRFGPEPGKETGAPYAPLFKWSLGKDWDWRTFDWHHDVTTLDTKLASTLNATNPDLTRFHKLGHKLIGYHGWADWLVVPGESIAYHDAVHVRDRNADAYYRLFMAPGVSHCNGGPGPDSFDFLAPLMSWVEQGQAPDQVIAKRKDGMTRPLCRYPRAAVYAGSGDTSKAENFRCQ